MISRKSYKKTRYSECYVLGENAKTTLQKIRDSGWEELLQKVCEFYEKHNIQVLNMDDLYIDNP
jgi:hypothetical protein